MKFKYKRKFLKDVNYYYIKINNIETQVVFPKPVNNFEQALQEDIIGNIRDKLTTYIKEYRPSEIRSPKVFGNYVNPDYIILDRGGLYNEITKEVKKND